MQQYRQVEQLRDIPAAAILVCRSRINAGSAVPTSPLRSQRQCASTVAVTRARSA